MSGQRRHTSLQAVLPPRQPNLRIAYLDALCKKPKMALTPGEIGAVAVFSLL
jgi:hypothetical protein